MAATAEVALNTARNSFLNDSNQTLWNDTNMIPKLQQAHLELQALIRKDLAPIMRKIATGTLAANSTVLTISDIIEPIRGWEKVTGSPITSYEPLTEKDPLPDQLPGTTLEVFQWDGAQINLIGATVNVDWKFNYWRSIPVPVVGSDSLVFVNAELYIAPRTAALCIGSLGQEQSYTVWSKIASDSLDVVLASNRGRRSMSEAVPETN